MDLGALHSVTLNCVQMASRALVLLPLLAVATAHAEEPAIAKIRKDIQAAMKKSPVKGMSVAVVKDGKVVLLEGFGYADVARRKKATADTVYEIGSSTKAFTALLAAQAAQEGKLSLKDRPSKYLPAFRLKDKNANDKITIEDMLSHRSGLPRVDLAWYVHDFPREDLLQILARAEPTAPLGVVWQYQNLMFLSVGMIEEKVYGLPFDALLADRFFRPLGMEHSGSTYAVTRAERELATGYSEEGDPLPLKPIDRIAPAGSISSSARDMAKYLQMLLANGAFEGRQVFAKEAIEETRKPRIAMPGGQYGLGWMLSTFHDAPTVFHGGNIDGFSAMVSLIPSEGLGVVALSNGNVASLPTEAVNIVYGALGPKEKADPAAAKLEEAADADLGTFHLDKPTIDLTFTREGKTVVMEQNGQKLPLKLVGAKRYTFQNALFMTFNVDGKRTVKVEQGPMTMMFAPAAPYKAPLSVAELVAKMAEAQGGAETIRRHDRMVVRYRRTMPSDALNVYGIRYRRDARSAADYAQLYALDRRIAESWDAVDGERTLSASSFAAPKVSKDPDDLVGNLLEAQINPVPYYKSVVIAREDKIGAVPVYVLVKTTAGGVKTAEFVSKADYRVLRSETRKGGQLARSDYSDFRNVDGQWIPFKAVTTNQDGVKTTEEVLSVRLDERVPDWPFRLP